MVIMKVISQVAIFAAFCLLGYSSHSVQLAPKSWVNDRIRDSISANDPTFSNEVNAVASAAWTNSLTDTESPNFALFSNAVLSVEFNFATNDVNSTTYIAATNFLASIGFDKDVMANLPGGKVYGSVGVLLAAFAAAIALLRKKSAHLDNDGLADETFATRLLGEPVAN